MIWLVATAWAEAPMTDLREGWYLLESGRVEEAVYVASDLLAEDPGDLGAHRLYINSLVRGLRGTDEARAMYEAWVAAEPETDAARFGLAVTLAWTHDDQGPWCDRVDDLLAETPSDPEDAYWWHRARYEVARTCPGDRDAERNALAALEGDAAFGYLVRLRLADGEVDAALAEDLRRWYASTPHDPPYVGSLFAEQLQGDALEEAQADAVEAARAAVALDTPVSVWNGIKGLRAAGLEAEEEAATARLETLDPGRFQAQRRQADDAVWLTRAPRSSETREIYYAQRKTPPLRALLALNALEVPDDGPDRAEWEHYVGENKGYGGRKGAELIHYRRSMEADPTPARTNTYAWAAAQRGEELVHALTVMDTLLATPPTWDAREGETWVRGYPEWRAEQLQLRARYLDTRAAVLLAMDRSDEAGRDLAEAVTLADQPIHHLHYGLWLAKRGSDEAALFHLGRALAGGTGHGAERREATDKASELFEKLRWAPDFDLWLASQAPAETVAPWMFDALPDYRVGQPFPDLEFQLDGETRKVSDFEGVRVIDLWATWCGPCVAALPHVSETARQYEGRATVLALSVDGSIEDVEGFRDRPRKPAYTEGYAGRDAMTEAGVRAIPAVFVLDADGYIVDYWTAARGERLHRALDLALEAEEPSVSP
ncbi:MAG: redoxin family protein [Proteobacteria bacterium]|nr:redoxin family protein [Pseudomonadota bacterium]